MKLGPEEIIKEASKISELDIKIVPDGTLMLSNNTVGRLNWAMLNWNVDLPLRMFYSLWIEDQVIRHKTFSTFCLMHELGHYTDLENCLKSKRDTLGNIPFFFGVNNPYYISSKEQELIHNYIVPKIFKNDPVHFEYSNTINESYPPSKVLTFHFDTEGAGANNSTELIANFVASMYVAPELTIKHCPNMSKRFIENIIESKYPTLLKKLFEYLL